MFMKLFKQLLLLLYTDNMFDKSKPNIIFNE